MILPSGRHCGRRCCSYKCRNKLISDIRKKDQQLENNYNWKGGLQHFPNGYVKKKVPGHPYADKAGYYLLHRWVMEQKLGRYLKKEEVVHHIDGNPSNNMISNLVLCNNSSDHFKKFHNHIAGIRKKQLDARRKNLIFEDRSLHPKVPL